MDNDKRLYEALDRKDKVIDESGIGQGLDEGKQQLCPVCGVKTHIAGKTKDGRVYGGCGDAFHLHIDKAGRHHWKLRPVTKKESEQTESDPVSESPLGDAPLQKWEYDKIHSEYTSLKAQSTADVLKTHKAGNRVSAAYSAAEIGGKNGLISDILHDRHGKRRVAAYFDQVKAAKKTLHQPKHGPDFVQDAEEAKKSKNWQCQECGAKFSTPKDKCPKCGGSDIDLAAVESIREEEADKKRWGGCPTCKGAGYASLDQLKAHPDWLTIKNTFFHWRKGKTNKYDCPACSHILGGSYKTEPPTKNVDMSVFKSRVPNVECAESESADHSDFSLSHGKKARGHGNWFVGINIKQVDFNHHKDGVDYIQHNGLFSDALKKAKAVAPPGSKLYALP